jgi:hypothetical protein
LSFSLLFLSFFPALDGACSDFTFYILLGDLALVELIRKEKLQAMAPLKTFLPFGKKKGAIEKMKKDYIKLYIILPKSFAFQDLGMSLLSISFNM